MNKRQGMAVFLAASLMLSGCTPIPYYEEDSSVFTEDSGDNSDSTPGGSSRKDEYSPKTFEVNAKEFIAKLNAEGGVTEGKILSNGEFDGKGYVRMTQGQTLTHIVSANTSEFYRIIICARSEKGSSVKLSQEGKTIGAYYIPGVVPDEEGKTDLKFALYAVDNIYLKAGTNTLCFSAENGTSDIDYIIAESSDKVAADCYKTGSAVVNPCAGIETAGVMSYFSDIYGKNVLTAQNVSVGTNAEIEAVYGETGRYPAIRQSELAGAVLSDDEEAKAAIEKDLKLAEEWSENGGIVAYTWHWYSPNVHRNVGVDCFDIDSAMNFSNPEEAAVMDTADIQTLVTNGFLPAETSSLIADIDTIAGKLKLLEEKKIPVLFEPVPDGESGLYWWGSSGSSYVKLWKLIFNRLCKYHKLSNLIFVWNGSSEEYYPGDRFCDIIGQSFYEKTDNSFAGRFSALANAFPAKKPLSVTACDIPPSPDNMNRDNALWLWCGISSGKYIINTDGTLSGKYNSAKSLDVMYNNTLYITRDELPDIGNYAAGG